MRTMICGMGEVAVGVALVLVSIGGVSAQTLPVDRRVLEYGDWRERLPKQSDTVTVRLDRATGNDELKPLRAPDADGWPVSP